MTSARLLLDVVVPGVSARIPILRDEQETPILGAPPEAVQASGVYVEITFPVLVLLNPVTFGDQDISDSEGSDAEIADRQLRFERNSPVAFDEDISVSD